MRYSTTILSLGQEGDWGTGLSAEVLVVARVKAEQGAMSTRPSKARHPAAETIHDLLYNWGVKPAEMPRAYSASAAQSMRVWVLGSKARPLA